MDFNAEWIDEDDINYLISYERENGRLKKYPTAAFTVLNGDYQFEWGINSLAQELSSLDRWTHTFIVRDMYNYMLLIVNKVNENVQYIFANASPDLLYPDRRLANKIISEFERALDKEWLRNFFKRK